MTTPDHRDPSLTPHDDEERATVLAWAKRQYNRHNREERFNKGLFLGFQSLTIVAAAAATVIAVADPNSMAPVWRAIPAAVATLAAAVMAAFRPQNESQRHGTAARLLDYEIVKFTHNLREYRPSPPRPQPFGADLFLDTVETISRQADQEPDVTHPDAYDGAESPTAKGTPPSPGTLLPLEDMPNG